MVNNKTSFPIFRKYERNTSFFKVVSDKKFIEIQVIGNTYFKHENESKILPDFHLINDMINLHNNHWVPSTELEFETYYNRYVNSLK